MASQGLEVFVGYPQAEGRGCPRAQLSMAQQDSLFSLPQGSRLLESSLSSSEGEEPVEYKSLQWFGATVRAHGSSILVRGQQAQWCGGQGMGSGWIKPGLEGRRKGLTGLNLRPLLLGLPRHALHCTAGAQRRSH